MSIKSWVGLGTVLMQQLQVCPSEIEDMIAIVDKNGDGDSFSLTFLFYKASLSPTCQSVSWLASCLVGQSVTQVCRFSLCRCLWTVTERHFQSRAILWSITW